MAIISTPRLTFSLFQLPDQSFFQKLRECPDATRHMGNIVPAKGTRLLFARRLAAQHTFVIREHNSPMPPGDIGLQISYLCPQEADLGYAIMPQAQGNGTASEAVRAVCQYALEHVGVTAINAYVLTNNKGPIHTLEKTDFMRTQVLEKTYEIDGIAYDDWVFRLGRDVLRLQARKTQRLRAAYLLQRSSKELL